MFGFETILAMTLKRQVMQNQWEGPSRIGYEMVARILRKR